MPDLTVLEDETGKNGKCGGSALWRMTETLLVVTFPFLILRLADFPRVPATQIWQHDLERTPSIGRKRLNLLPKKPKSNLIVHQIAALGTEGP
jgi:hypothetical protein